MTQISTTSTTPVSQGPTTTTLLVPGQSPPEVGKPPCPSPSLPEPAALSVPVAPEHCVKVILTLMRGRRWHASSVSDPALSFRIGFSDQAGSSGLCQEPALSHADFPDPQVSLDIGFNRTAAFTIAPPAMASKLRAFQGTPHFTRFSKFFTCIPRTEPFCYLLRCRYDFKLILRCGNLSIHVEVDPMMWRVLRFSAATMVALDSWAMAGPMRARILCPRRIPGTTVSKEEVRAITLETTSRPTRRKVSLLHSQGRVHSLSHTSNRFSQCYRRALLRQPPK